MVVVMESTENRKSHDLSVGLRNRWRRERRGYLLLQTLVRSQSVNSFAYAKGAPISRPDNPRSSVEPKNIFYTDSLRIVMELTDEPTPIDEILYVDWETVDSGTQEAAN